MRRNPTPMRRAARSGTTVREVLMVLICIVSLLALILPKTQTASGRLTPCYNRQANLAKAIIIYSGTHNARLPQLRGDVEIENDSNVATPPLHAPWAVAILPQMGQRKLYDELLTLRSSASGTSEAFQELSQQVIADFTCSDDPRSGTAGALSYVANAGYILNEDWNKAKTSIDTPNLIRIDWRNGESFDRFSEEDQYISQSVALFIDAAGTDRRNDYSDMYDGTTATILLTENLDAGQWTDTTLQSIGFGMRVSATNHVPTVIGISGQSDVTALTLPDPFTLSTSRLNSITPDSGIAPRPSSNHPGGVIITFCDGRAKFVSEMIDDRVYAQAITPSGSRYGQNLITNGQLIITDQSTN